MQRAIALLPLVCIALFSPASRASEYGEPYLPDGARGVSGSVRWETLRQAAYTNANVFGAVGAYERYFRPIAQDPSRADDAFFVFAEEMYYTSRIASAPVYCQGVVSATCEDTVAEFTFDQFSGGFAMGGGTRNYGLFTATSWSLTAPSNELYPGTAYAPLMPMVTGWALSFGKDAYASVFPGSVDGLMAGYVSAGPVQGSAGYVLSSGAFGDLSLPPLRAFATAVLTDAASEVGLFKSGLRELDIPRLFAEQQDARSVIGTTTAYARQLKFKPPDPSRTQDDPELLGTSFWTGHFEQHDIGGVVDLLGAYSFAPEPILHQAMVAVHSTTPEKAEPGKKRSSKEDDWGTTFYAAAGIVELPSLWYYGVEGGRGIALNGELRFGSERAGGKVFVRRNDPEFLAAFPFGQNAINTGLAVYVTEGL